jgi:UDP-N-acetylmuramoylalanine--D-glutamate ligase
MNYKNNFKDKKITVMGLGLLGRGLGDVQFLAEAGAELIVTDLKTVEQLEPTLKKLAKFKNIKFVLGQHRLEDFHNRDFILKAGGVPLDSIYIAEARKQKIPIKMSESWFAEFAPVKIIGVTGTRGKSTVTQLIYEILCAVPRLRSGQKNPQIFLGGNVRGVSTLSLLKKVKPGDIVVMELDSWRLQGFGESRLSPHIAVFTNLLPDHLNYYGGDLEKYFADKANIFKYQKTGDYLICGSNIAARLAAKPVEALPKSWKLKLPGEHNRENAAFAKNVAEIVGVKSVLIKKVITGFTGVAGRLELVKTIKGIKIYNDTTSTTPAALAAALRALGKNKNIILIMGGADKNLDFAEVFPLIKKYCKEVILLPGTGTNKLTLDGEKVETLKQAVESAMNKAKSGEIILFSPGFASFGLFKNEFDRGDQFNALVSGLK